MSLSLADMKKSKKSTLEALINKANSQNSNNNNQKDDRFWQPTVDKAGNGNAIIRFLPAAPVDGDDAVPWVKYFDHAFKGPTGRWYIEKSLTTFGQPDPVGEKNSELWNSGRQDEARAQKRRLHFISNILVVKDPANPENDGKVFLFSYGQKIFEKIKNVMTPDEDLGEEPNDPFNFWEGQNFKLKIKKVSDFRNYDDSAFAAKSAISKNDNEIENIWNSEYSLKEFVDPANYKSYEELKKQLNTVLGTANESLATRIQRTSMETEAEDYASDESEMMEVEEDANLDDILAGLE